MPLHLKETQHVLGRLRDPFRVLLGSAYVLALTLKSSPNPVYECQTIALALFGALLSFFCI